MTADDTVSRTARMVSEFPIQGLPDGITRWRINRKRDDGTWDKGEWVDGAPPQLLDSPRSDLLEYDVRSLTPRRVTIIGDRVREWTAEDLATDPPAFLSKRMVEHLRGETE